MELQTIFKSPLYAFIVSVVIAILFRIFSKNPPPIRNLINNSLIYIGVFLATSFVYMIIWMVYYEYTTEFSAGNAPLGWIFIYAPLAITCGLIIGLFHWIIKDTLLNLKGKHMK